MNLKKNNTSSSLHVVGHGALDKGVERKAIVENMIARNFDLTSIFRGWAWRVICAAFLIVPTMLPVSGSDDHPVYPKGFTEAAQAFKSAPPTNRYDLAATLMNILPTTRETNTNRSIDYKSRGSRFVTRDYSKPSFLLTESEVIKLLGSPSFTNSATYNYLIQLKGTNNLQTFLLIDFHNGLVVSTAIY